MSYYPKISIITPSYNQGPYLEKTINSILEQKYPNLEYIIIDGGSIDDSVSIIQKYNKYITYWISEKDKGQSHAINKGFNISTGNILGWLNSDDEYYPGTLNRISQIDWEKYDFCFGKGMWISKKGEDLCQYPTFKPDKYSLFFQCTICQPTVFFSRRVWNELGELSTNFQCSFDYEYWLRAIFGRKTFYHSGHLLAKSRMYHENKSMSSQHIVNEERHKLLEMYFKNQRLSPSKMFLYKISVDYKTHKRIKLLHNTMNTNT